LQLRTVDTLFINRMRESTLMESCRTTLTVFNHGLPGPASTSCPVDVQYIDACGHSGVWQIYGIRVDCGAQQQFHTNCILAHNRLICEDWRISVDNLSTWHNVGVHSAEHPSTPQGLSLWTPRPIPEVMSKTTRMPPENRQWEKIPKA
jgi:hypothetical protein